MVLICSRHLPKMANIWNPDDVLDVYPSEDRFVCVGTTDSGLRCTSTSISPSSHREARAILDDLQTSSRDLSILVTGGWLFPLLHQLATLTLCSKKHRYDCDWHSSWRMGRLYEPEAVLVAHKWFEIIRDMPNRVVDGGLRQQPAIPEYVADYFEDARSSAGDPVAVPEASSSRNNNGAISGNLLPETSVSTPSSQPVQRVSRSRMGQSHGTPSAIAHEDNASTEPFASDIYSATPQTGNRTRQLDPAQVATLLSEIGSRTDGHRPDVQAYVDELASVQSQRPTPASDGTTISSLNDPGELVASPGSVGSMTPSSHGTIANNENHQGQSTPSSPESNNTPTASRPQEIKAQLNNFLPPNIGGIISAALIKALSYPISLKDALNSSLNTSAAVTTQSRAPSLSIQPTLCHRTTHSPSVYHTPSQSTGSIGTLPSMVSEEVTRQAAVNVNSTESATKTGHTSDSNQGQDHNTTHVPVSRAPLPCPQVNTTNIQHPNTLPPNHPTVPPEKTLHSRHNPPPPPRFSHPGLVSRPTPTSKAKSSSP
jgi:hypothetical protein